MTDNLLTSREGLIFAQFLPGLPSQHADCTRYWKLDYFNALGHSIWVSSISDWYLLPYLFCYISHVAIPAFTPVKNLLTIIISKDLAIWLNPDKTAAMITKTLLTSRDIFLQREETRLWAQMHRSALWGVVSKTGICINRKSARLTQFGPSLTTTMTTGRPCRAGFMHREGPLESSPRLTAPALPIGMGRNISIFQYFQVSQVEFLSKTRKKRKFSWPVVASNSLQSQRAALPSGIFLLFMKGMILLLSSTRWNFSLDKKATSLPGLHNHGKSVCGGQPSDPTPKHSSACVSMWEEHPKGTAHRGKFLGSGGKQVQSNLLLGYVGYTNGDFL